MTLDAFYKVKPVVLRASEIIEVGDLADPRCVLHRKTYGFVSVEVHRGQ